MSDRLIHELVGEDTVRLCAEDVAERLNRLVPWNKRDVVMLTILHGAKPWSDLLLPAVRREFGSVPYETSIGMSSYVGTRSTGEVRARLDPHSESVLTTAASLTAPVVIVEDIIDTGTTLLAIIDLLGQFGIAADRVIVATMCIRKNKLKHRISISRGIVHHEAIEVPIVAGLNVASKLFLVGFGFDHNGEYRDLPYLGYLNP